MASHPIYQFYAELDDFKPKIWRRFQVSENISVARLGYIIQVLFEMTASHLMAFEAPAAKGEYRVAPVGGDFFAIEKKPNLRLVGNEEKTTVRRYEMMDEDYEQFEDPQRNVLVADAVRARLRNALPKPGDKINFNYDFGDDWWVSLTLEEIIEDKELPGKELPRVLEGKGFGIVEDVGGTGGLQELVRAFKKKKGEEYEQLSEWLGIADFDIDSFDMGDMNFRLKKIPRIYKQIYEDRLAPTQRSIDLIERGYRKNIATSL